MTSSTFDLVRSAIENKQQIHADFQGFNRKMCPHVLGYQNGTEQALFCQFGGESKTDGQVTPETRKWRCMPLEKLTNVKIVDGSWYTLTTKGEHPQTCVTEIIIEVPYT